MRPWEVSNIFYDVAQLLLAEEPRKQRAKHMSEAASADLGSVFCLHIRYRCSMVFRLHTALFTDADNVWQVVFFGGDLQRIWKSPKWCLHRIPLLTGLHHCSYRRGTKLRKRIFFRQFTLFFTYPGFSADVQCDSCFCNIANSKMLEGLDSIRVLSNQCWTQICEFYILISDGCKLASHRVSPIQGQQQTLLLF